MFLYSYLFTTSQSVSFFVNISLNIHACLDNGFFVIQLSKISFCINKNSVTADNQALLIEGY